MRKCEGIGVRKCEGTGVRKCEGTGVRKCEGTGVRPSSSSSSSRLPWCRVMSVDPGGAVSVDPGGAVSVDPGGPERPLTGLTPRQASPPDRPHLLTGLTP